METVLLIEAEGQPSVQIVIAAEPDIIFQDVGIQGPPGPGIVEYDPGDLTLIFDNQLI